MSAPAERVPIATVGPLRGTLNPSDYWMRSTSLKVLWHLVLAVRHQNQPVAARELNSILLNEYSSAVRGEGARLGASSRYHYRRAAEKLGLLRRVGRRFVVNQEDPLVGAMVKTVAFDDPAAQVALSQIVVRCTQPRRAFFDIFMPSGADYDAVVFMRDAHPVVWRTSRVDGRRTAYLVNPDTGTSVQLDSPVKVSSVLYGVRYWAKDELHIVDEYYGEGEGVTMFSVTNQADVATARARHGLASLLSTDREWSEFSVGHLVESLCMPLHVSKAAMFGVIAELRQKLPGDIVTIPVPPNLVTLLTKTRLQGSLKLQDYLTDGSEYVGHVRVHADVRRHLEIQS